MFSSSTLSMSRILPQLHIIHTRHASSRAVWMIEWTRGFVASLLITTHVVGVDAFGSGALWEVFALDRWSMRACSNPSQCKSHLPTQISNSMLEHPSLHRLLVHVIFELFPITIRHQFRALSEWLLAIGTDDWFRTMTVFCVVGTSIN